MSDNPEFKPGEGPKESDDPEAKQKNEDEFTPVEAGGEEISEETPPPAPHTLSETPEELGADQEEETEAVKEPSKFQQFLRQGLIWLGVIAGGFLAGFLTFYFVLYQPKVAALEEAESQVQGLQSQLDTVNSRLETLEDADTHRTLLEAMVDAYDARLAMARENVVAAKSALSGTTATLEEISAEIEAFDSGLASALPQRIELIRTNLDRDLETAIADCDQLIEDLIEVEQALFQ